VSVFAVSMTIGTPGLGPDLTAHVDSVGAGQHQVKQHQIGPGIPEGLERLVAVGDERRLEPSPRSTMPSISASAASSSTTSTRPFMGPIVPLIDSAWTQATPIYLLSDTCSALAFPICG
jgi:hypothetical protein